jgi:hypothetical protein
MNNPGYGTRVSDYCLPSVETPGLLTQYGRRYAAFDLWLPLCMYDPEFSHAS